MLNSKNCNFGISLLRLSLNRFSHKTEINSQLCLKLLSIEFQQGSCDTRWISIISGWLLDRE